MYAMEEPGNCIKRRVLQLCLRQNGNQPADHGQTFAHCGNQTPTDQANDADDKVLTPSPETCDTITEQIEDCMARQNGRGSSRPRPLIRKIALTLRSSGSRLEVLALLLAL